MIKNNESITQKKFNKITIGLSSPEVILGSSRGEVLKPEQSITELTNLKEMAFFVKKNFWSS